METFYPGESNARRSKMQFIALYKYHTQIRSKFLNPLPNLPYAYSPQVSTSLMPP